MGLLDLIGDAVIDAYNANTEEKIQQEINTSVDISSNENMRIREAWVNRANNTKKACERSLYKMGLQKATDDITLVVGTASYKKVMKEFFQHLDGRVSFGLDIIKNYVKEAYDFYLDANGSYIKLMQGNSDFEYIFEDVKKMWISNIKNIILEGLQGVESLNHDPDLEERINFLGIKSFLLDNAFLLILLGYITKDTKYEEVFDIVCEYCHEIHYAMNALQEEEYGSFNIDDSFSAGKTCVQIENDILNVKQHICENETGYFEGIKKYLNNSVLKNTSAYLWYYARLKPFNQGKFNEAVKLRNFFTSSTRNNFEVILAELYVKNELGGEELVRQNLQAVLKEILESNSGFTKTLCSFLAWIECYNLEYEVLKYAVSNKIQLSEEMQKRLILLSENGNMPLVKIYKVSDTSDFHFDTHSLEWGKSEYETLFRKLETSHTELNYALAIKEWHKPFSIQRGKKFDIESLENEFKNLLADFDGEVILTKKPAAALNVTNMAYSQAYIFSFTSERNRGINVLFHYEKFGRNLQLNIIITFLPDDKMNYKDMLVYALSAKDSIYIKSFLESILQAIDNSLIDKNGSVYDL